MSAASASGENARTRFDATFRQPYALPRKRKGITATAVMPSSRRRDCIDSGSGMEPPSEVQVQVLHVIQEALSNARKHAEACAVTVSVERGAVYRFTVRDDGRGFDASRRGDSDRHVGLAIMRERAHRIGAALDVRSAQGEGTQVILSLPVAVPQEEAA